MASRPANSTVSSHRPGRLRRGFTLLEVLVAVAVLSVMLITIYQAYGSNIYIQSFNRDLWRAVLHAHNELARYERMPPPPISVNEGAYDENHALAGYRWKRLVTNATPIPGVVLRQVTLELSWDDGGVTRSYEAVVYVMPK